MPKDKEKGNKKIIDIFGVEIELSRSVVSLEEEKDFLRIKIIDKETNKEIFNKVIIC